MFTAIVLFIPGWSDAAETEEVQQAAAEEITQELEAKRQALEEIKKKADLYEQNVKTKQQEAKTLQNQLSLLDTQVDQTQNDIDKITIEIDTLNLELEALGVAIDEKTEEVRQNQEVLADFLRLIDRYDQQSTLEILMTNTSFSDFFDTFQYTQKLEEKVTTTLQTMKQVKFDLEQQEQEKAGKKKELSDLSNQLSETVQALGSQKEYKVILLEDTKGDEETYQQLYEQAVAEQRAAEAEVGSLESKARKQLQEQGIDLDVDAQLIWPVAPLKGISAYFHDPSYPFRSVFEHSAIDIPASQGTPIVAADNGYVVRAKNAGLGYSYIMIVHSDTISTVYGHVSRIDVTEDEYVVRGQQIGAVGGLPGTAGAGPFTTGAHLHFEVRSSGLPVNPLDYLPGF
ncbi:MAG: murein hydrolase activator EnvC family protein [Patescibacteria group bacterium]